MIVVQEDPMLLSLVERCLTGEWLDEGQLNIARLDSWMSASSELMHVIGEDIHLRIKFDEKILLKF